MKAIIETGGKQYIVSEGSIIYVEKLDSIVYCLKNKWLILDI